MAPGPIEATESNTLEDPPVESSATPEGPDPSPKKTTAKKRTAAQATKEKKEVGANKDGRVPIVGIGASAGGLDAFEQFFTHMPPDSGMAFVLVQHLDPTHKSILGDLVMRYTRMDVFQVTDNMDIKPNCAYIIPPNSDLAILHGALHLIEPTARRGLRLPIDYFFRSLAQDQGDRGICIVLSGTGTDGTLGLRAVKGEGGMVMVQDPASSRYDGMPRSAIGTGLVDYVLPPEKMPEELIAYVRQSFGMGVKKASIPIAAPKAADYLHKIFILLRAQTGHDFFYYKQNTIQRRIERRMVINQIERLSDYVRYLQQNPLETETLFKELLIGVTNFFRDPEAFEILRTKIIPALVEGRSSDLPLRVWVPACSTGEEAYSIALLFREYADQAQKDFKVQVFGTDIDPDAIETARSGIYPESIAVDVPQKTLTRFFTKEGNSYQVNKSIRAMLVFAEQSVVKDPPFSKLDLVSCRNLLIYMQPELQKKVFPVFHYALNPDGYLFLGSAETIGDFTNLFTVVDRRWKLFQSRGSLAQLGPGIKFTIPPLSVNLPLKGKEESPSNKVSLRDFAERTLLEHYAPACILINERCDALYIHGHTGKYLEPARGEANLNILEMAREGLRLELTTAIRKATSQKKEVRCERLRVKANGHDQILNLTVSPVMEPAALRGLLMVVIEDVVQDALDVVGGAQKSAKLSNSAARQIAELEQELHSNKEYLQTTIEELETSNEELTSTNEELQSSNEELQSTNEELETSKEELQSVNEELVTVNSELEIKIDQLAHTSNDLSNLLASTDIDTIFLDTDLRLRRFTPSASRVFNLIGTDLGRPIGHIVSNIDYAGWKDDAINVLDRLEPIAREIRTQDGHWYAMRIRPYRTTDNIIDGVVLTFVDIDPQKKVQDELLKLTRAIEHSPSSVMITTATGIIEYINPKFTAITGYNSQEILGQNPKILKSGEHPKAFYQDLWDALKAGREWHGEFHNRRKNGELYWELASISPIHNGQGVITHFVATKTDITERRQAEEELRISERRYALTQRIAGIGSWDWDITTGKLYWSESMESLFGFEPGGFPGTHEAFLECVHPDDRPLLVNSVNACVEQGAEYAIEHRIVHPDGMVHRVAEWGDVMRDPHGKAVRMLGIVRELGLED